jgi:hypothetical protein
MGASGQGSSPVGARKAPALERFAGLPRRYDAAGAMLSFGQDPVDEGDGRPRRCGTARPRARARGRSGRGEALTYRASAGCPGAAARSATRTAALSTSPPMKR